MQNVEPQNKLSPEEISFLIEKKSSLAKNLFLFPCGVLIAFGYYFLILDRTLEYFLLTFVLCIFYSIIFAKNLVQTIKINRDTSGGTKEFFTAVIDDFKLVTYQPKNSNHTYLEHYFYLEGVKYEVKEEYFYRFAKGDRVKVYIAPHSRYAFTFERA